MTYPAVPLPTQTPSEHRRPGIFPGRRFALAAAVACAAAGAAGLPAGAAADQAVVGATIFPGTQGSASSAQVMLTTLSTCDSYAGPSSITMQSATQTLPEQPVSEPAWTLGTVLTCGLQIPGDDVNAVQVVNFSGKVETPLSNGQIFDTGQYPGSGGALPTIYRDGDEDQTTYVRPPLSPSDPNAADNVVQQGDPIALIVYENQPPLTITVAQSPVAGSQGTTEQVTLSPSVTTADGTAVPSSALTFGWTVDNAQLTDPAPVVTVDAGVTPVTVQAYDPATGTGGTYTFDITYNPPATPTTQTSTTPTPGAGQHDNGGPTGKTHGKQDSHGKRKLNHGGGLDDAGANPGAGRTRAQRRSTTSSSKSPATTPATTPTTTPATTPATSPTLPPTAPPTIQTTTVTTTTTTPAPGLTVDSSPTKAPPHPRHHAAKRRSAVRRSASQRLVTGRLVADVQALPAGASPLVHPIAAQAAAPSLVHGASDNPSAPTWAYAALVVLALLGGGALYERRGRRGRTLHR